MSTALTPEQIYDVLIQAGFTGHAAIEGTAIALAESSGVPTATHLNNNGTTDYGLFQMNHASPPNWDWQNPLTNAQMAKKLYDNTGGWGRWATWTSGAYRLHLPVAQQASADYTAKFNAGQNPDGHYNWNPINDVQVAGRKGASAIGGVIQDKLAPLAALSSFLGTVGGAIGSKAFWLRVGLAVIGLFLLIAGVVVFIKPAADNAAGRIVPV